MREDVNTIKVTIENPNNLTRFHKLQGRFAVVMVAYDNGNEAELDAHLSGKICKSDLEAIAYQLGRMITEALAKEEESRWLIKLKTIPAFIKGLLGFEF